MMGNRGTGEVKARGDFPGGELSVLQEREDFPPNRVRQRLECRAKAHVTAPFYLDVFLNRR